MAFILVDDEFFWNNFMEIQAHHTESDGKSQQRLIPTRTYFDIMIFPTKLGLSDLKYYIKFSLRPTRDILLPSVGHKHALLTFLCVGISSGVLVRLLITEIMSVIVFWIRYMTLFLLLGRERASTVVKRLPRNMTAASTGCRTYSDDRPEFADLLKPGHIGPILQESGGELTIKKYRVPPHGHREKAEDRFTWLFSKAYHDRIFFIRLFECGIVDQVVLADSRRWPALIYDSAEIYPIILSSLSLFYCAGPDAVKAKVTSLHEVIWMRRTGEKPNNLKR